MKQTLGYLLVFFAKILVLLGWGIVYGAILVYIAAFFSTQLRELVEQNFLMSLMLLFCGFVLAIGGPQLVYLGRRLQIPSVEQLLKKDKRAPILLLRPFYHDREQDAYSEKKFTGGWFSSLNESLSIEYNLVKALNSRGPVVAIGKPGEKLPPLGAARMYTTDDQWQQKVLEFLDKAQLIVVILSFTPSVAWEIEQVTADRLLPKTVFIIPPALTGGDWPMGWQQFRQRFPFLEENYRELMAFRIAAENDVRYLKR